MRSLPYDYCRCLNDTCPLRDQCIRWQHHPVEASRPKDEYARIPYSHYDAPVDGVCPHRIKPESRLFSKPTPSTPSQP